MSFTSQVIGTLAVSVWLSLAAVDRPVADPPTPQPREEVPPPHRDLKHSDLKPSGSAVLEKYRQQKREAREQQEQAEAQLKKEYELARQRKKEEADQARKLAEEREAPFRRRRGSFSQIFLGVVVALFVLAYRTFKSPEH